MAEIEGAKNAFTRVDELREKIRRLERVLAGYGFNDRRGIETWKISEIKNVLRKTRSPEKVKETLKELVETQEILYRELYRIAGAKEIVVDTDTPEKRLKEIKEWLEGRRKKNGKTEGLFEKAVHKVLKSIEEDMNPSSAVEALNRLYKRDYDRFRVLEFVLSLCKEIDVNIERSTQQDLSEIAKVVVFHVSKVGVDKIRKLAKVKLRA
jgi:hypothetical protein